MVRAPLIMFRSMQGLALLVQERLGRDMAPLSLGVPSIGCSEASQNLRPAPVVGDEVSRDADLVVPVRRTGTTHQTSQTRQVLHPHCVAAAWSRRNLQVAEIAVRSAGWRKSAGQNGPQI